MRPPRPFRRKTDGRWQTTFRGRCITAPTEAECWAKLHAAQCEAGLPGQRPATVAEVVDRYLIEHPSPHARRRCNILIDVAGGTLLTDIGPGFLDVFLRKRKTAGVKPWTIRHDLGYALSVLRFAVESGWLRTMPRSPYRRRGAVPTPLKSPRGLDPAELAAVLAAMEAHPRRRRALALARFIVATGCRPSEACDLRWEQARRDSDGTVLRFVRDTSKTTNVTGQPRIIMLSDEARACLPESQRSGPVFRSRLDRAFTPQGLRSTLRRAAEETLGHAIGGYALRHTFAELSLDTLGLDGLKEAMGHRDIRTTMIYLRNQRLPHNLEHLTVLPPPAPALAAPPVPPSAAVADDHPRAAHKTRPPESAPRRRRAKHTAG